MKKNLFLFAAATCLVAIACSKEDSQPVGLEGVLYDVAKEGTQVWVETNQFIDEDFDFEGRAYRDVNAVLKAVKAAGYAADTALPEGRIDTENKKFGCALLRKKVYNFRGAPHHQTVTANYYTEECACLNSTRSRYTRYDGGWHGNSTNDTIKIMGNVGFHVTNLSNVHFEGNQVGDNSRSYRFELMSKSTLISAGLTKLDD